MDSFDRAASLVKALFAGKPVSIPWIMEEFGVSKPTAKRDLCRIERLLPVKTTRRKAQQGGLGARELTL